MKETELNQNALFDMKTSKEKSSKLLDLLRESNNRLCDVISKEKPVLEIYSEIYAEYGYSTKR